MQKGSSVTLCECIALLDGLKRHYAANLGNWRRHAAGSLPRENLSGVVWAQN